MKIIVLEHSGISNNDSQIAFRDMCRLIICSHIYREGNCCEDALATLGNDMPDTTWFQTMAVSLSIDFTRDRNGLPNFRFS